MSVLREAISHATLGWVKPELDEILRQARIVLEQHAEQPDAGGGLNACVELLHQAHGTLRMLELPAPAMVAEEMERLAQALRDDQVGHPAEASTTLMRGTVLLPDYLERLQSGHRDIPIVLLPLLNDLRAARGATVLGEHALLDSGVGEHSEAELDHARGSLSGRNRALLDSVGSAVKEELLQVKDEMDLYLRGARQQPEQLQLQVETLSGVADTLQLLGLQAARDGVLAQRDALAQIASGQRPANEDTLLDIAGALLRVDAAVDEQANRLGAVGDEDDAELARRTESRALLGVLIDEALLNLAEARRLFVAFIETGWNHEQLEQVPRLLREVGGALRMLELAEPSAFLGALRAHIRGELLQRRRVPDSRQLDHLADALSSLEYYLEAVRDQRPRREDILEITRGSLDALGAWPPPADVPDEESEDAAPALSLVEEGTQDAVVESAQPDGSGTETEAETETVKPAPETVEMPVEATASETVATISETVAAVPQGAGFQARGEDIDDEIREVFVEEFGEEIANLDTLLPAWRAAPEDLEQLRPIRRVFHTLKGSGRLVGASVLGEFSWKIESALNRVLDGSRAPSPAVVELVTLAHATLPQLREALRGRGEVSADLAGIEAVADRVAAGEEVFHRGEASIEVVPPPAPVVEETPQGTPASVDGVLLEILDSEISTHLSTVELWLGDVVGNGLRADERLLRAMHTINGAFAMTEVPEITEVTLPAEGYVKRLLAADLPASDAGVAAIAQTADAVRRTLAALHEEQPRVPVFAELAAQIVALRDGLPAPVARPIDSADDEEPAPAQPTDAFVDGLPSIAPPMALGEAEDEESDATVAEARDEIVEAPGELAIGADAPKTDVSTLELVAIDDTPASRSDYEAVTFFSVGMTYVRAGQPPALSETRAAATPTSHAAGEAVSASEETTGTSASSLLELLPIDEEIEATLPNGGLPGAGSAETEDEVAETAELTDAEPETALVEEFSVEEIVVEGLDAEADEPGSAAVELSVSDETGDGVPGEGVAAAEPESGESTTSPGIAGEAEAIEFDAVEPETVEVESETAEPEAVEAAVVEDASEIPASAAVQAEIAQTETTSTPAPVLHAAPIGSRLPAAAEDPDLPLDLGEHDPELVDVFIEEGTDLLDHADGLLSQLDGAAEDRERLIGLQRDLHTLKGGARMAGLYAVGELGHAIEAVLQSAVQQGELQSGDVPLLERGFDRLHAMLTRVAARRAIGLPQALIDEFDQRARRAPQPAEASDETFSEIGMAEPVHAPRELKPLSAPIEAWSPGDDDDLPQPLAQEQVRVRADLLDRLVNHAGEVAIYRAHLEQQLGAFRNAMGEMEQTNARLRDQLRRLDIETEAQIVARYQREQDQGDPAFDPLELDRFSTLQQLSRALSESAADLTSLQGVLDDLARQYDALLHQQSRVSSELQDGLMRTRMLPFDTLAPRLRRVVRQAAEDAGKAVEFHLQGAHGELDRSVLQRMTAPLEHMLRNAVAHGLESAEARVAAGKPAQGNVTLSLLREGSEVVLQVGDDGGGLDREAIRARAVSRGLLAEDATPAETDLDALIFESGFSTADTVSRLAGRGVGMDVVRNEVRQLGGTVDISTTPGAGTRFTLRLPQTLAVTQAVLVQAGDTFFAVPVGALQGVGRIARERMDDAGVAPYRYGGEDYTLYDLGNLVGQAPGRGEGQDQLPLLLVRAGQLRAAVAVDQVLGSREIVVKAVGPQIASVPGIYGATILGDGRIAMILDLAPLVRRHLAQPQLLAPTIEAEQRQVPLVMVVDDSLTMRKVTGRVLERHNLEVVAARDGVEALERLAERVPDLLLLDIEMPRMDGYELATRMKADPRLRQVPIVMITSRTGDKHRQRAFDIGVERYMGKPYQEPDLMRNVYDLLGLARARQ